MSEAKKHIYKYGSRPFRVTLNGEDVGSRARDADVEEGWVEFWNTITEAPDMPKYSRNAEGWQVANWVEVPGGYARVIDGKVPTHREHGVVTVEPIK